MVVDQAPVSFYGLFGIQNPILNPRAFTVSMSATISSRIVSSLAVKQVRDCSLGNPVRSRRSSSPSTLARPLRPSTQRRRAAASCSGVREGNGAGVDERAVVDEVSTVITPTRPSPNGNDGPGVILATTAFLSLLVRRAWFIREPKPPGKICRVTGGMATPRCRRHQGAHVG